MDPVLLATVIVAKIHFLRRNFFSISFHFLNNNIIIIYFRVFKYILGLLTMFLSSLAFLNLFLGVFSGIFLGIFDV